MQNIQPISSWNNGQLQTATQLEVVIVYDNLANTADFRYTLYTADRLNIASDRINIAGEDYINWGSNADVNLAAYEWVAGKLNLTIDYTTTTTTTTTEELTTTTTSTTIIEEPIVEEPVITTEESTTVAPDIV